MAIPTATTVTKTRPKVKFFIHQNEGQIDYFEYDGTGDKYQALREYLSNHFTLEEIANSEVYEARQLVVRLSIEPAPVSELDNIGVHLRNK